MRVYGTVLASLKTFILKGGLSLARQFRERTSIFPLAEILAGIGPPILLPNETCASRCAQWNWEPQGSGQALFACRFVSRTRVTFPPT